MEGMRELVVRLGALLCACGSTLAAQAEVRGVVRGPGDAPLPMVTIVVTSRDSLATRSAMSDGRGVFRVRLVPGEWRLVARRVGMRPDTLQLSYAGEGSANEIELRLDPLPAVLDTTRVTTESCPSLEDRENPWWAQVEAGIEARRLTEANFHYEVDLRTTSRQRRRIGGLKERTRMDSIVHVAGPPPEPQDPSHIYRRGLNVKVRFFEETLLLTDQFRAEYCIEPNVVGSDSMPLYEVRFAPRRIDDSKVMVRGAITLDRTTYRARRIVYEFVRGRRVEGAGEVTYGDIEVEGAAIAMPTRYTARLVPPVVYRALIASAEVERSLSDYRDFRRATPPQSLVAATSDH